MMFLRYRGKVGQYLYEKEMERMERYKDRPWELQSRNQAGGSPFIVMLIVLSAVVLIMGLLSFL